MHIHITGGAGKNERRIRHLDKRISEKGIYLIWAQTLFYNQWVSDLSQSHFTNIIQILKKTDVSNVYFILIQFVNKDYHDIFKLKKIIGRQKCFFNYIAFFSLYFIKTSFLLCRYRIILTTVLLFKICLANRKQIL